MSDFTFLLLAVLAVTLSFVPSVHTMDTRLDDCNFHQSVDLSEFESTRTLLVNPPEGEVIPQ